MSDIAAKLRSIAQDWDRDGELHQALAGAAAELDEQAAELERMRSQQHNLIHQRDAAYTTTRQQSASIADLEQLVSEAEARANGRGRKMIQCCFCNEQCESLEALKTHSGECPDHPAVKEIEGLVRALDENWVTHQRVVDAEAKVAAIKQQVAASGLELAAYRGWKDHIESSHDVDGWAAGFYWKQELEKAQQQVRQHAEDWAETDTHVRAVAKRFLPAEKVDGDSHGVPPIEDIVDALSDHIDKVEQQVAGLTAENAELRNRVEFCCNVDVPEQVAALRAENERLRTSINLCSGSCRAPD